MPGCSCTSVLIGNFRRAQVSSSRRPHLVGSLRHSADFSRVTGQTPGPKPNGYTLASIPHPDFVMTQPRASLGRVRHRAQMLSVR
jgi:hypothetical protein